MDIRHENASNQGKGRKRKDVYSCDVMALSRSGVLDMYSYHRGREGFELRDPYSGTLRCPCPPTDTNHNYDAPRMQVKVVVEFPLEDDKEIDRQAQYRETFDWDLTNPETPSPAVFASKIASEFGLSHGQMMDLAIKIESQIATHMQQNWNYCPPLSITDPLGNERRLGRQPVPRQRFDPTMGVADAGTHLKRKDKPGSVSRASSVAGSVCGAKKKKIDDQIAGEIDEIFVNEVRRRGRIESVLDVTSKCKNGVIGLMERKGDEYCHLCRKSCQVIFHFACGNPGHEYCEAHCKVRPSMFELQFLISA